jgi:hypothetical protein
MNNSSIQLEETIIDVSSILKEKEAGTIVNISALRKVSESNEWSTLKTNIFDGITERLRREIMGEARKENPDTLKLARLSGELKWAERYSDLSVLENSLKLDLINLRRQLHGKTEEPGGNARDGARNGS